MEKINSPKHLPSILQLKKLFEFHIPLATQDFGDTVFIFVLFSCQILWPPEASYHYLILQRRKLRLRHRERILQSHRASIWVFWFLQGL